MPNTPSADAWVRDRGHDVVNPFALLSKFLDSMLQELDPEPGRPVSRKKQVGLCVDWATAVDAARQFAPCCGLPLEDVYRRIERANTAFARAEVALLNPGELSPGERQEVIRTLCLTSEADELLPLADYTAVTWASCLQRVGDGDEGAARGGAAITYHSPHSTAHTLVAVASTECEFAPLNRASAELANFSRVIDRFSRVYRGRDIVYPHSRYLTDELKNRLDAARAELLRADDRSSLWGRLMDRVERYDQHVCELVLARPDRVSQALETVALELRTGGQELVPLEAKVDAAPETSASVRLPRLIEVINKVGLKGHELDLAMLVAKGGEVRFADVKLKLGDVHVESMYKRIHKKIKRLGWKMYRLNNHITAGPIG
ncbi:hypothetical protein J8F10_09365 [Gemmata sp. G18]|uniref:Uncharacterized protein n=1 Tax=Gemmata palustris TaxID=2822762 RepID=A0ABS5BP86_9BACT|nr:hypothetical protein [Gemmata palustris]MBP3955489.1 hypothetical protein [Gemmata palustris]